MTTVVCLPGDGIGAEVMAEATRALRILDPALELVEMPIGWGAHQRHGVALPPETLAACLEADAVLMGAVGVDDQLETDVNPEQAMFELRRRLDVFANLRPFRAGPIDLLIVRELVGGLYFGERGTRPDGSVFDTCVYHPDEVERVLRRGFAAAAERRGRLTSVDKANVLATSRMWRKLAISLAGEYATVELDHLLIDTAAMRMVQAPESFDVIVTENTFGDILSDVAAGVCGGLGFAASACLGASAPGLFEPVHGTAPDIAGQGIANPAAMLLSTAMMLRYGLGRPEQAQSLEEAVDHALRAAPTRDMGGDASTRAFGACVAERLSRDRSVPTAPGIAP